MVIRIKKLEKEGLDEIIILLMILQVLIIRWVSESIFNFFNIVLVTMIGIALLRYRSLMNSKCIITLLFFIIPGFKLYSIRWKDGLLLTKLV